MLIPQQEWSGCCVSGCVCNCGVCMFRFAKEDGACIQGCANKLVIPVHCWFTNQLVRGPTVDQRTLRHGYMPPRPPYLSETSSPRSAC